MAFLATPLLIYFAYETILMKNFSFSDVKEIEKFKKKNFFICYVNLKKKGFSEPKSGMYKSVKIPEVDS
jgi:Cys-tRNA synthase (O-phospho-L-seryl-tRNA:Cys-tRNA synthase)